MKFKKKMVLVLMMALCSSMLLVSCGNADEGKKIEKMLEDIYGGNFTLTDSVAVRPTIYFFQSPITSHYQYYYKWDRYNGKEKIWVTTKRGGYQTNVTYVMYRPKLTDYYTAELEKRFPGGVIAPYLLATIGFDETKLEEFDFEDVLESMDVRYMCILAVDDVNDHKAIENAIDEVFGNFRTTVEVHVASKDDVDALFKKAKPYDDNLKLYTFFENKLPPHEFYCYSAETSFVKGRKGWFSR